MSRFTGAKHVHVEAFHQIFDCSLDMIHEHTMHTCMCEKTYANAHAFIQGDWSVSDTISDISEICVELCSPV